MFGLPFIVSSMSCRKSSNQSTLKGSNSSTAPAMTDQEFIKISEGTVSAPKFSIDGHINEIRLDVYAPHFDGFIIESRTLSVAEWENLRIVLETGTEVVNRKLLALSARLRFFNEKNKVIYGFVLYWTSESGSVYFQNKQGWFEVSDRASILSVLNTESGRGE
jgi:hypothetical protein